MSKKQFISGYIECAFWADGNDEQLGANEGPHGSCLEAMEKDAGAFFDANGDTLLEANVYYNEAGDDIGRNDEHLGHDLWLSRNRHGAGFWDRGLGDVGDKLDKAAKAVGERYLYVGDDGLIYQS